MVKKHIRRFKDRLLHAYGMYIYHNAPKVFVIGRNKTGTTSMAKLFRRLGIPVGDQRKAELLMRSWKAKEFDPIIAYVKTSGVVFQDIPFSLPGTYAAMDKAFPEAKFILTIRDSPEVWYESLTRFHAKMFGEGKVPNREQLMNSKYVWKGWVWEVNRAFYGTPEDEPYHKETMIASYEAYNRSVIEYFTGRPDKLLIINLKEENAAAKINSFLPWKTKIREIPWTNKTNNVRTRSSL